MKIVIAPDKFKGSLLTARVAAAIAAGRGTLTADGVTTIIDMPLNSIPPTCDVPAPASGTCRSPRSPDGCRLISRTES